MDNFWPSEFQPEEIINPTKILEEQAKILPKITKDLVYAEVSELNLNDRLNVDLHEDFAYAFYLYGKHLENYRYRVFVFCHNIFIYPTILKLDREIAKELGATEHTKFNLKSQQDFEELLSKVLRSKTMNKIVSSIMRMSFQ